MQRNSGWRAGVRTKKVLLPGVSVLARLVAEVRAEAGDRGMRVLCGCRRLAQGLGEPVNASVDDVRVAKGGDVGQSLGDAHGGVRRSRRAVPCQCGHEPVRGFHRDVDVVLPALKQDRRPMSEVLEVSDRV